MLRLVYYFKGVHLALFQIGGFVIFTPPTFMLGVAKCHPSAIKSGRSILAELAASSIS